MKAKQQQQPPHPVKKVQQKKVQQKKVQQKKVQQHAATATARSLPPQTKKPIAAPAPAPALTKATANNDDNDSFGYEEEEEDFIHKPEVKKPTPTTPTTTKTTTGNGPTFYAKKAPVGGSVGGELDTSDEELCAAVHGVRADDDATSWIIMGYGGSKTALQLYAKGEGGLDEFITALDEFDSEVVYGYLRVFYGENARPKFVFVTLVPEGLSGMAKAKANMHKTAVERFVQSFHTYFNISSTAEINARLVEEKLHAAGGAHYGRGEGGGVSGGGEDFGGMKRLASQNFAAKGATILSTAKSPKAASSSSSSVTTILSTKPPREEPATKKKTTTTTSAEPPKPKAKPAPVKTTAVAPKQQQQQQRRVPGGFDDDDDNNNDSDSDEDRFAFKKPQLRSVSKQQQKTPAAMPQGKKNKSIFEELGSGSDSEEEEEKESVKVSVKKATPTPAPAPAPPAKKPISFDDSDDDDEEDEEEKKRKEEEEKAKKMEEDKFMSDYQRRKQALMQKKAAATSTSTTSTASASAASDDEEEEEKKKKVATTAAPPPPPVESEEDKIAKTIAVIKEKGVEDEEIGMIAVLYGDIKGDVDEKMIFKLRDRGNIIFTGTSLDDDAVLSFIEDP